MPEITAPIQRAPSTQPGEESARWHSTSTEGSNVVPLAPSILLIEDNREMSALVAGVLGNKYRVFCAYDGQEGLEKAFKLRPSLLLSNVMLPRMSGDQVLAELRRCPDFDDMPIMLLTDVADEQLRLKLLHEGAQDYLQKPFEPAEVLARVARLIADRQRSAQNVQAHEQRLAAIIHSAMDAIITVDAEQRIIVFNRAAEETFGCSAEEVLGQPLEIFIPAQYRQAHREYVDLFGATGKITRSMHSPANLMALRKDGTVFPIEATISQATIQGNKLYTVILRDVTHRRQTEAALVQSQKLASLGRFAATLAHEINNPLEAVLNLLHLAQLDESVSADARCLLQMAREEIERAVQIARQTLGFSRGGTRINHFRPARAIESVLALLAPKLRSKQIECEIDLGSSQEIEGVESEMRQVFWNLLINSFDALPQGGRIRVRVDSFPKTGTAPSRIRITIADNGCGIPHERAATLFEPFQTTKESGNGLGLWVSKQVVKKHHGSIRVNSRSGAGRTGTVFSIILPTKFIPESESTKGMHAALADFVQTRGA